MCFKFESKIHGLYICMSLLGSSPRPKIVKKTEKFNHEHDNNN